MSLKCLFLCSTNGILKKIIFVIDMVLTDPTENFFVVSVTIYFLRIIQLRSKGSPPPTRPSLAENPGNGVKNYSLTKKCSNT